MIEGACTNYAPGCTAQPCPVPGLMGGFKRVLVRIQYKTQAWQAGDSGD